MRVSVSATAAVWLSMSQGRSAISGRSKRRSDLSGGFTSYRLPGVFEVELAEGSIKPHPRSPHRRNGRGFIGDPKSIIGVSNTSLAGA